MLSKLLPWVGGCSLILLYTGAGLAQNAANQPNPDIKTLEKERDWFKFQALLLKAYTGVA